MVALTIPALLQRPLTFLSILLLDDLTTPLLQAGLVHLSFFSSSSFSSIRLLHSSLPSNVL
jgi:hypothetical protein